MRSLLRNSLSKKAFLSLVSAILFFSNVAIAQTYISKKSGSWASSSNWTNSGNGTPTASTDVSIKTAHSMTIDASDITNCLSLDIEGTGTLIVDGTLNIYGTISTTSLSKITLSPGSTINFAGSSTSVMTLPNLPYSNLVISKGGSGMNLSQTLSIAGSLTIANGGILDNAGFRMNSTNAGTFNTLALDAGSKLILSGLNTSSFSTLIDFATKSFSPYNTVTATAASILSIQGNNLTVDLAASKLLTYGKIEFTGTGNTLKLLDNTIITESLDLNGTLDLNSKTLTLGDKILKISGTNANPIIGATPLSSNHIKLTTGKVTVENIGSGGRTGNILFPVGTGSTYTPVTISNLNPAQEFSVALKDAVYADGIGGTPLTINEVKKTWDITSANGANATIILQWNKIDEGSNFNRNQCVFSHFTNSAWDADGGSTTSAGVVPGGSPTNGPFYMIRTGIASFSPFGVGSYGSPLPVELVSFMATKKNAEVALTWETASEKNNAGFEVQASNDGKNYEAIGFAVSKNGNASNSQRYAYTHKTGNKEGLMYYRLKQVDMNGEFEYYTAKVVDLGRFASTASTFPNPFQNRFELNLNSTTAETAQITITDMAGKTVYQTAQKLQKGVNTLNVELNNQPSGLYLIKATAGNQIYTNRLVKQ